MNDSSWSLVLFSLQELLKARVLWSVMDTFYACQTSSSDISQTCQGLFPSLFFLRTQKYAYQFKIQSVIRNLLLSVDQFTPC